MAKKESGKSTEAETKTEVEPKPVIPCWLSTATVLDDPDKIHAIAIILGYEFEGLDDDDLDGEYKEMLNECYDSPKVACCEIEAGDFLEQNDPIAYRCGYSDWLDSRDDLYEVCGVYVDDDKLEENLDEMADALKELTGAE